MTRSSPATALVIARALRASVALNALAGRTRCLVSATNIVYPPTNFPANLTGNASQRILCVTARTIATIARMSSAAQSKFFLFCLVEPLWFGNMREFIISKNINPFSNPGGVDSWIGILEILRVLRALTTRWLLPHWLLPSSDKVSLSHFSHLQKLLVAIQSKAIRKNESDQLLTN